MYDNIPTKAFSYAYLKILGILWNFQKSLILWEQFF